MSGRPNTGTRVDPVEVDRRGRAHLEAHQAEQRGRGAYYTPLVLVRVIVRRALQLVDGVPASVLDPACGSGAFLLAAFEALTARGLAPDEAADRLHGTDSDPGAVALARELLHEAGVSRAVTARNVREADGLAGPWPGPERYELILGNPPHLGEEDHRDTLARAAAATGLRAPRGDLAYHFTARALDLLAPGGALALILPGALTDADSARALRRRLVEEVRLIEASDLGGGAVFDGQIQQPTVLVLARRAEPAERFGRLTWLAEPRSDQVVRALFRHLPASARCWAARVPRPADRRWPQAPEPTRPPPVSTARLGEVFQVNQGVVPGPARATAKAVGRVLTARTGRTATAGEIAAYARRRGFTLGAGVFVLSTTEAATLRAAGVPDDLLVPFVRPAALRPGRCPRDTGERLLYLTAGSCPEVDAHPALRGHLARFRPLLERRRETRRGTRAWYHLHWPRDPAIFHAPRLLVPRQAPALLAAYCRAPRYVDLGCNVITGGDPDALRRLAEYLNGPAAADWIAAHGKRKGKILQIDGGVLRELPL